ncbi:MAG: hypothetical protein IKO40_09430 [Kiritimatiellae bacterium]|nr:hypothetical protein [Kiritimatiellia bacterium]
MGSAKGIWSVESARWIKVAAVAMAVATASMSLETLAAHPLARIRLVNTGSTSIELDDGSTMPPGSSAMVEVPANIPGQIAGFEYPALSSGEVHTLRVSGQPPAADTGRGGLSPIQERPDARAGKSPSGQKPPSAGSKAGLKQPAKPSSGAPSSVAFKFPTLFVRSSGDNKRGGCSYGEFSFQRDNSVRPLRISSSDDISGGSSTQIRASLWQAAMTAALLRKNPMRGVRIEREFSGFVDGPSAGGVTCLAILSALDGRKFPEDFAMTGTIMADGTIGLVGGVALKLEGAKAAGISRVCIPAFERIESQNDDTLVDLHDKARSLGIELYPVCNVEEAYAVAHHLPYVSIVPLTDSEVYRDSEPVEMAIVSYIGDAAEDSSSARENVEKAKEVDEDDVANTAFDVMGDSRSLPSLDIALKSGMYHVGIDMAARKNAFWRGQFALARRINWAVTVFPLDDPTSYLRWEISTLEELQKYSKSIVAQEKWIDAVGGEHGLSPLAAQCVPVNLNAEMKNNVYRVFVPDVSANDGEDADNLRGIAVSRLLRREALCSWYGAYADSLNSGWREVANALPKLRPTTDIAAVEDFFFSALVAQDNAIGEDFNQFAKLLEKNYDWTLYRLKATEAIEHHSRVKELPDANDDRVAFERMVSIMCQIDALAHGSMISVIFGNEIGSSINEEGDFVIPDDKPYLGYLLRNARIEAVKAIAECDVAGIPCPRVRAHVETGDYYRESRGYDVFDVLREYWAAMLKAKALYMVFASDCQGK